MKNEANEGLLVYNQYLHRKRIALVIVVIATMLVAIYSIGIGSISISIKDIVKVFLGSGDKMHTTAVMNISEYGNRHRIQTDLYGKSGQYIKRQSLRNSIDHERSRW